MGRKHTFEDCEWKIIQIILGYLDLYILILANKLKLEPLEPPTKSF